MFTAGAQARPLGWSLGALLACGWPVAASAQSSADAAAVAAQAQVQEGLRREEARNRLQQRALQAQSDILKPAIPVDPLSEVAPAETPCFVIEAIEFAGRDSSQFGWLAQQARPYEQRCLGTKGLAQLAATLDKALVVRGYATSRVSLPAQNLRTGLLRVQVHVGRIEAIRASTPNGQPDQQWGTWRNAMPLGAGDILNVRDLEQGLEQMKRLPSQEVRTRLEPGVGADTSVLVIERATGSALGRLRGGVTLDNSGGRELGRAQFSANLALDNPSGLNDIVSLNLGSNLQHLEATRRSQSLGLTYSIPWGYNLLTLSSSHSRFAQGVQGTTAQFLSSGNSQSAELRLHRTVWRDSASKLGLQAALSTRRANSFIDDVELLVQRRRTTNVELGLGFKHLFQRATLDLDLSYRRGVPWRSAQEDFADAADGGLTLRPRLWTLSASYSTPLFEAATNSAPQARWPLQWSTTLRAQYTPNTTLSVDQIAIGGRSSVRGFDGDGALLAENGLIWRNELSLPYTGAWLPAAISTAYMALDYGRVWGPSDMALVGRQLAGAAVGLRGNARGVVFDASLGLPLLQPSGFRTKGASAYLSFTYPF